MDQDTLYKELAIQKVEMTPQERITSYLRGEEVDCIPYGFLAPEDALANIWGYTKGEVHRSFDIRCEMIRRKKRNMVSPVWAYRWDFAVSEKHLALRSRTRKHE